MNWQEIHYSDLPGDSVFREALPRVEEGFREMKWAELIGDHVFELGAVRVAAKVPGVTMPVSPSICKEECRSTQPEVTSTFNQLRLVAGRKAPGSEGNRPRQIKLLRSGYFTRR